MANQEFIKQINLYIGNMICLKCKEKIENNLINTEGIKTVDINFNNSIASIDYDETVISVQNIIEIIEKLGYQASLSNKKKHSNLKIVFGVICIMIASFILLHYSGLTFIFNYFPIAEANTSYIMLFVIGLATSLHCLAMCGGINLSQTLSVKNQNVSNNRLKTLQPGFLYNLGRLISYTIIGGIIGAIGSVISFDNTMRGIIQLIAGIFMIIMALIILDIFPSFKKFIPKMPKILSKKIENKVETTKRPFYIGILNGFMPCGPLQTMQIYALSTGSFLSGALSMFLFCMGTIPLMFALSATSSFLSKKWADKVTIIGAALVLVLGLSMFFYGLNLSGFGNVLFQPKISAGSITKPELSEKDGIQIIRSTLLPNKYPAISAQSGIPVKWIIDAPAGSINGCNNEMIIPEYNIRHKFQQGENIIEFTPTKSGKFIYSCWMGMIRGIIFIVGEGEDAEAIAQDLEKESNELVPAYFIISTEDSNIGIAKISDNMQTINVEITSASIKPGILIVQAGIDLVLNINNKSPRIEDCALLIPSIPVSVNLNNGINQIGLTPIKSFEFSNGDNSAYVYVKTVENINKFDIEAIKKEVAAFETLIYPSNLYDTAGCCGQ
jgi:sulfite exporter TauE/SafE/copper chaperone CopZ/plastocyanin domain-containing protein